MNNLSATRYSLLATDLPTVDVIVVLWHSRQYLSDLFDGLERLDYPREKWAIHVVDNSPGDGSLAEARRLAMERSGRLPEVVFHEPGSNTGFAGGNNLAIRKAMERNRDYVYLLNHDAAFESGALKEAVAVAETDKNIGSVQSLLVLMQSPDEVNSRGNAIQFLGFGYCAGYHEKRDAISLDLSRIAYASGAGVLYPLRVLKEVGLFDETLFAYHEDLDLGWRLLIAGYRNLLAPKSVVRHKYEFSRSITKWYWMERNRLIVVYKNYRLPTIILLLPILIATEFAILAFAISGGWWKEKLRAMVWFLRPSSWIYLIRSRREISRSRKIPDSIVLSHFTPFIAYQELEKDIVKQFANPFWALTYRLLLMMVKW
jgi:GT2 family glycosyltransferase